MLSQSQAQEKRRFEEEAAKKRQEEEKKRAVELKIAEERDTELNNIDDFMIFGFATSSMKIPSL